MTLIEEQTRGPSKRLPKPVGRAVVVLILLALVVPIALGGRALYNSTFGAPDYSGNGTGSVVVQVKPGDFATAIAATLLAKGVIKSERAFTKAAQADSRSKTVQPGFYALHLKMAAAKALTLLLDPKARVRGRVTLPEGISLAQVVDRFAKYTEVPRADMVAALNNPNVLGLPSYAGNRPEGFLFPATYDVEPGTAAVDAIMMTTQKFAEVAAAIDLEGGARRLHLSPYDVVKIASLVEAETSVAADRAKVARVVLNRLAIGMPLQLDSTVNYLLTQKKARLSLTDIGIASPYNTYLHKGLPPTPIDSPGELALQAALAPATGTWLYFITIDKAGHSLFTNSYSEFLAAKAKAQRDGVY
ncbi:MAG: aminodeoxychorismate lyase [Frankiales bacterium]|nr:aminodeoxychorismate lyase [Frankiales bacterium]